MVAQGTLQVALTGRSRLIFSPSMQGSVPVSNDTETSRLNDETQEGTTRHSIPPVYPVLILLYDPQQPGQSLHCLIPAASWETDHLEYHWPTRILRNLIRVREPGGMQIDVPAVWYRRNAKFGIIPLLGSSLTAYSYR